MRLFRAQGYTIDPYATGLYPQVAHIQMQGTSTVAVKAEPNGSHDMADVFVFPSGTVVVWSAEEATTSNTVRRLLTPAAEMLHLDNMETEELEYVEDASKDNSTIRRDTIILGTKALAADPTMSDQSPLQSSIILTKIAYSSGLARSTKLAVLETQLANYFDSTRTIPTMLSHGNRLPFTRSFILRKTGQLLHVRAQLNLYSELTDSLPDIFWDSKYELGLEGYYDHVCRVLDVGDRIKVLNQRMDYAQEIASVLRERLSERHSLVLEWTIIALIAIEVAFEILRLVKEKA